MNDVYSTIKILQNTIKSSKIAIKDIVKNLLLQGIAITEITEKSGISGSTIRNIRKELWSDK